MVVDALVQCYSRFGMPSMHVSEQRSHFKDKVIKEFTRVLEINHHVTTPCSPWANGTLEKVNNDIQKLLRSLSSEWQMESSQWPLLLPAIQSVLNHLPSPSRANCAPLKIMTDLDAFSPLSVIFDPDANKIWDCPKPVGLPREGMLTRSPQL